VTAALGGGQGTKTILEGAARVDWGGELRWGYFDPPPMVGPKWAKLGRQFFFFFLFWFNFFWLEFILNELSLQQI
jgi:hypothetical protein